MKEKMLIGLLVLSTLLFITPVKASSESIVVYALPYEFYEKIPLTAVSYPAHQWMSSIFVGLYQRDQFNDRYFSPLLADTPPKIELNGTDFYSSTITMRFTIHLQTGLFFSNGDPLTADDVVYSYRMLLMPNYSTINTYNAMTNILWDNNSVYNLDDYTVVIETQIQWAAYYNLLSVYVYPKEVYQPAIDSGLTITQIEEQYEDYLIGAGPFAFDRNHSNDTMITVVKNPYWSGHPQYADKIVFKTFQTKDQVLPEFYAGNVHIIDQAFMLTPNDLNDTSTVTTENVTDTAWKEMSFNHMHPVFGDTAQQDQFIGKNYTDYYNYDDFTVTSYWYDQGVFDENARRERARLVRQAIDTIIPREKICNESTKPLIPAATIWPPTAHGYDPNIQPRAYNVQEARNLMTQAGFNYSTLEYDEIQDTYRTYFFNFTLLIPTSSVNVDPWTGYISDYLGKIGIGVKTILDNWGNIGPRLFAYPPNNYPIPLHDQGGYDVIIVGYRDGIDFDPYGLYETYSWIWNGGFNWYNWYDLAYDPLSEKYETTIDYKARENIAHEIQNYYHYQVIVSAIYYPVELWGYNKELQGYDTVLLSHGEQQWEYVGYNTNTQPTTTSGETPQPTTTPSTSTNTSQSQVTTKSNLALNNYFLLSTMIMVLATGSLMRRKQRKQRIG